MAKELLRGFHAVPAAVNMGPNLKWLKEDRNAFPIACKAQGLSFVYFEVSAGNIPAKDAYDRGFRFHEVGIKVGPYHRWSNAISGREQAESFVRIMTKGEPNSLLGNGKYTLRPGLYIPNAEMLNLASEIYEWVQTVSLALYAHGDNVMLPILMASQRTVEMAGLANNDFIQPNLALWLHGGNVEVLRQDGWQVPMWLQEVDFPVADQLMHFDMAVELGPSRFELFPKVNIDSVPFVAGLATVGGVWYAKNVIFKKRP